MKSARLLLQKKTASDIGTDAMRLDENATWVNTLLIPSDSGFHGGDIAQRMFKSPLFMIRRAYSSSSSKSSGVQVYSFPSIASIRPKTFVRKNSIQEERKMEISFLIRSRIRTCPVANRLKGNKSVVGIRYLEQSHLALRNALIPS
jgi:hypothetical protein